MHLIVIISIADTFTFYGVERTEKSLQQFIDGLNILNVFYTVKRYPEYFVELLCYTTEGILTLNTINNLFDVY